MKIYCDESGYTGADLLQPDQPYFVYAGVHLDEKTTSSIIRYIRSNVDVQSNEIKGKHLVNTRQGRAVIKHIFSRYGRRARIVYHDKKYALAGKIIEYGIEPYLPSNHLFYASKFHLFLASALYANFLSQEESAEKLFQNFLLLMRGKKTFDEASLHSISKNDAVMEWLLDIITHKPEIILDEIQTADGESQPWILGLTMNSLLGILTDWSKEGKSLQVICDNSKVFERDPLIHSLNQIGASGATGDFLGTKFGFKLDDKISYGDSIQMPELQIADLFSSTVFYCLKNPETQFSKEIMKIVVNRCLCKPTTFCVLPQLASFKNKIKKNAELFQQMMAAIYKLVKST